MGAEVKPLKNKIMKAATLPAVAGVIWILSRMLNACDQVPPSQHVNPTPGVIIPIIGLLIVFYLVHKNRIIKEKQTD